MIHLSPFSSSRQTPSPLAAPSLQALSPRCLHHSPGPPAWTTERPSITPEHLLRLTIPSPFCLTPSCSSSLLRLSELTWNSTRYLVDRATVASPGPGSSLVVMYAPPLFGCRVPATLLLSRGLSYSPISSRTSLPISAPPVDSTRIS